MALQYHPVARRVINGPHEGEEWYFAQVRCSGKVPFDKICERVSQQSSATKGDVEMVLDGFITELCFELSEGNGVQLGALGNFRITSSSKGIPLGEKYSGSDMGKPRITFFPGKELKHSATEISFEKIKPITVKVHKNCKHDDGYIDL